MRVGLIKAVPVDHWSNEKQALLVRSCYGENPSPAPLRTLVYTVKILEADDIYIGHHRRIWVRIPLGPLTNEQIRSLCLCYL